MENYTIMKIKIPKGMTEDISNYITSVTGGDAYLSIDNTSKKEVVWVPINNKQNQKGRVMAKLHSRNTIKKIKLEMMEEFITKINQYGVNKFLRNGISNPDVIYQIKKYDETLRFETVEKYLNTIDDLMGVKKRLA